MQDVLLSLHLSRLLGDASKVLINAVTVKYANKEEYNYGTGDCDSEEFHYG